MLSQIVCARNHLRPVKEGLYDIAIENIEIFKKDAKQISVTYENDVLQRGFSLYLGGSKIYEGSSGGNLFAGENIPLSLLEYHSLQFVIKDLTWEETDLSFLFIAENYKGPVVSRGAQLSLPWAWPEALSTQNRLRIMCGMAGLQTYLPIDLPEKLERLADRYHALEAYQLLDRGQEVVSVLSDCQSVSCIPDCVRILTPEHVQIGENSVFAGQYFNALSYRLKGKADIVFPEPGVTYELLYFNTFGRRRLLDLALVLDEELIRGLSKECNEPQNTNKYYGAPRNPIS